MTDSEMNLLSREEPTKNYRLACEAKIEKEDGPMHVRVPKSSLRTTRVIVVEEKDMEFEKEPIVRKYILRVFKSTLEDITADFERIKRDQKAVRNRCKRASM
ncbi:MAG: hypothetical protein ACTSXJ_09475 [Candidatus Baldrarchaeia archaeon]